MSTRDLLLSTWSWHPAVLAGCALAWAGSVLLFGSPSEGKKGGRPSPQRAAESDLAPHPNPWVLGAGLIILCLTLLSPLNALAEGYLFSAHMLQHLLLLLVVPPLVLLSWPQRAAPPGLRHLFGGRLARALTHPFGTWLCGVGAMWLWHAPALCNAAASRPDVRGLQTASLLVLGALFWWPILGPQTSQRLSPWAGIFYLFTACVGCTILGIIITFAPVSVCPAYLHPADRLGLLPLIRDGWGITPAIDQQIGGLLMWVPACLIYLLAILSLLARWYGEGEEDAPVIDAGPPSAITDKELEHA